MENEPFILAVDRNARNLELLAHFLNKGGYSIIKVSTDEEMAKVLTDISRFQLALVDLTGFDKSIWEFCERLRIASIPLLVISHKQSAAIQKESIVHGAMGVLVKPLVVKELMHLIHSLLKDET